MSLRFYKENNLEKTADSIREINESNETYGISDTGVVDGELSETSENPVQNKIITAALNKKIDKELTVTDISKKGIIPAETFEDAVDCSAALQTIINGITDEKTALFFPAGHYTFKKINIPRTLTLLGEANTVFDVIYRTGIPTHKYNKSTGNKDIIQETQEKVLSSHYTIFQCNAVSQQYSNEEELKQAVSDTGVKLTVKNIDFHGSSPLYTSTATDSLYSDPLIHLREADLYLENVKFDGIYQISAKDDGAGEYINFPNLVRNIDGSTYFKNISIHDCMGKELMWLPCPNKFDECSFECHGIDMSNFTGSINSYCKNSDLKNVYLHDVIYAGSSFNLFNDYVNVDKADADDTVLETAKFYPYFKYPVKGSIDTYEGGLWNCQSVNATNLGDNIAFYFLADTANVSGGYCTTTFGLFTGEWDTLKHRKFPKKLDITFSDCYFAYHGTITGKVENTIYKRTTKYVTDNNIVPRITYHNCKTRPNSNAYDINVNVAYNQCDIYPAMPGPEFIPDEYSKASTFNVLTSQPEDWTENFGNYYTYSPKTSSAEAKYVGLTAAQNWEPDKYYERIQVSPDNTDEADWEYNFKTRNWKYWKLRSDNTYGIWTIDQAGLFGSASQIEFNQCNFDTKFDDYLTGGSVRLVQCSSASMLYLCPVKVRFVSLINCKNIAFWDTSTGLKTADCDKYNMSLCRTVSSDKMSYGSIDCGYDETYKTYKINDLVPRNYIDNKIADEIDKINALTVQYGTALEKVSIVENKLKSDAALADYLLWIDDYTETDRSFSIYQRKSERKKNGNGYSARYLRYDFDYNHPQTNLTLKAILNGKGTTSATGAGFSFEGDSIVKFAASLSLGSEISGGSFTELLIDGFDGVSMFSDIDESKQRTFLFSSAKVVRLRGLNTRKSFNGFSDWTFADGGLVWTAADLRTARESETENKLIINASQVSDGCTKIYLPDGGTDGTGYGDRCYAFDLFGFADETGKNNLLATVTATLPFEVNSKEFKHTFYTAAEGLDVIRFSASEF